MTTALLVIASVIAGIVVGVVGLYIYVVWKLFLER